MYPITSALFLYASKLTWLEQLVWVVSEGLIYFLFSCSVDAHGTLVHC